MITMEALFTNGTDPHSLPWSGKNAFEYELFSKKIFEVWQKHL